MGNEQNNDQKQEFEATNRSSTDKSMEHHDVAESKRREWERQQEKKGQD
ncbi:MAG TPA: hypothetical protein VFT51_08365 [Bacillales bacterium]|nr:hypothetical protein [Bacillales bacterium]